MNDEVRIKLKELVATYRTELSTDIRKVEGLLRDYCGEHKREIAVLISCMKNRIPEEILGFKGDTIDQLKFSRLAKKLHVNEGIAEEYAEWAVESWEVALGKEVQTNCETTSQTTETKDEEEARKQDGLIKHQISEEKQKIKDSIEEYNKKENQFTGILITASFIMTISIHLNIVDRYSWSWKESFGVSVCISLFSIALIGGIPMYLYCKRNKKKQIEIECIHKKRIKEIEKRKYSS